MQGVSIGLPGYIKISAKSSYLNIVWLNHQRTVENRSCFRITSQKQIALCYLYQPVNIARVQLHGMFQFRHGSFELALSVFDQPDKLEYTAVVRQTLTCQFEFI